SLRAEARLEGARLVVDAGVDHAAVVAGLMRGDPGFLVEDDHACLRIAVRQGKGGGEAHDAAPDDGDVRGLLSHGAENTIASLARIAPKRRLCSGAGGIGGGGGAAGVVGPLEGAPPPWGGVPQKEGGG